MKCGISPEDYGKQKHFFVDAVQQIAHRSKAHVHLVAHGKKGGGDEKIGSVHDVKGTVRDCGLSRKPDFCMAQ